MSDLLYVLAGRYSDAKEYAYIYHRLKARDFVSVDSPDKLRGVRGLKMYVLSSAQIRDNYAEIMRKAVERQMDIEYV